MKSNTSPDIEGLIRTSPWFVDLPTQGVERLVQAAYIKHLKNKEYMYYPSESTGEVYCLYEGRIRISTGSSEGQIFALVDLEPDYWLGEAILVHRKKPIINAQAKANSSLLCFPRPVVLDVCDQHPIVYRALFNEHVKRTRGLYELLNGMLFFPLRSRLAGRLLDIARTNGEQTPEGVYLNIKLNQNDFARLCLGSRQSVNKILREWYSNDVVVMHDKRYLIKNIDALKSELTGYGGDLYDI